MLGFLSHSQSHIRQYPLLLLQNFLILDEVSHFKPQLHGNENVILHVQDLTCYWDKVNLLLLNVKYICAAGIFSLKSSMSMYSVLMFCIPSFVYENPFSMLN